MIYTSEKLNSFNKFSCKESPVGLYKGVEYQKNSKKMRMKRLTVVLVALLVAVAPGYCQTKREVNVARKEAAAAARNLKRSGFKSIELGDVQIRLEKYFLKVNSGCAEIVGIAENCMSMNLAQITALSNAANQYALLAGGDVRGRIIGSTNNLSDQQMDNIVSSFERIVEKNIRGELVPYITAVRERKDRYNVRAYCIVDIDSAYRIRRRALEIALEEQSLAEKYGSMVSSWIGDGFNRRKDL